jgi:NAD+ kinase
MKSLSVGLLANRSPRALDLALESADFLRDRVKTMRVEEDLMASMLERDGTLKPVCLPLEGGRGLDLALVFGGDGTILRAARILDGTEAPICGINMGRMGFLSQVEPRDLQPSLNRLLDGDYDVCSRMKLDVDLGADRKGAALNELLVQGDRIGKVFRGGVQIGSGGGLSLEGDGLIVATPTGSTGHSLSAGGSVVDCELDAIIVCPLAAMNPVRPIIVAPDKEIVITPSDACTLAIDGMEVSKASQGEEIRVSASDHRALFAVLEPGFFWRKLRQRIGG